LIHAARFAVVALLAGALACARAPASAPKQGLVVASGQLRSFSISVPAGVECRQARGAEARLETFCFVGSHEILRAAPVESFLAPTDWDTRPVTLNRLAGRDSKPKSAADHSRELGIDLPSDALSGAPIHGKILTFWYRDLDAQTAALADAMIASLQMTDRRS
jgi:hypothetical protein